MKRPRIRRRIRPATTAILLLLAFPAPAQESNFEPGYLPDAPTDGGFRYFEVATSSGPLNMREEASGRSAVIARLERGGALNNLGCIAREGRAWCDVQPVGGGTRGYVAAEFLSPAVAPNGAPVTGVDDSALRTGQGDFDATGSIPCAQSAGQPMTECSFGVARGGGGDATVVVTRPDGRKRAIFFSLGSPISADTSEADPGEFRATRTGYLSTVYIGDERYELPDAIPLGG